MAEPSEKTVVPPVVPAEERISNSPQTRKTLIDDEASDVVQETFIGVAKNLQKKKFDTSLGSFKSFLLNQARWRILDQFRRRKKQQEREVNIHGDFEDD